MSFAIFSREFTAASYTSVENRFISKYLPQADGDAVRVYLYGLYLCQCAEEFDAVNAAKLLKIPYERFLEIFRFWEECDLVHILSADPLFVEYLPVNAAAGKPKALRPEKYAEFNRAFYKLLQKAGTDLKPYEMQRILEFLENQPMEQQAFLLVAEYCVNKDGAKLSASHLLNKAEKLCRERKYTYEQVEADLADYNTHEKELTRVFALLGIYRKPQEGDYDFLEKWKKMGMDPQTVLACARSLKKGTLATLDLLIEELAEKGITGERAAQEYLARREETAAIVFKVARKLGVKVQNPRPFAEEYAEKWVEHGYDEESLLLLSGVCMKLGYGFPELDAEISSLYKNGIVDSEGVKAYCGERDRDLRLLQKIQQACGVVKKSRSALDMISAWRSWNFSEAMMLEAAKRSANASSPLPYMNKLLSEWKREGWTSPEEIKERSFTAPASPVSPSVEAADARSERARYYALLRRKAEDEAERVRAIAEKDDAFREAEAACRKGELELARAEVYDPASLPSLQTALEDARKRRRDALIRLAISEESLLPQYHCKKCSDSGFLPDGRSCDCYKK